MMFARAAYQKSGSVGGFTTSSIRLDRKLAEGVSGIWSAIDAPRWRVVLDVSLLIVDPSSDFVESVRGHLTESAPTWSVTHASTCSDAELSASMRAFDAVIVSACAGHDSAGDLLASIQEVQPDCVRLILADVQTLDAVTELVTLCHRILVVPCDPFTLQMAVEHARRLRDTLGASGVRALGLRRRNKDSRRPTGDLLSTV